MQRKVAIFDIDGTIFRSSLIVELVEVLIERQIFPKKTLGEYEKEHTAWLNRYGPYKPYIEAVVRVFMQYLAGVESERVIDAAKDVVLEQENRIYRYTRDLIAKLKSDGYYLLAISHSPKFILDEFGRRHGFDKIYGKVYVIGNDGKFTGEIKDHELIGNKSEILKRAIEKENLTLNDSVGVGDTESDISFLSLVSKPICFNPNKALYEEARSKNWLMVVERKDVIYEIAGLPADSVK
ncbi:MAG: HAD-IB family hydrolase [Candidatus Zambryskibacteria bacterium]|nr:HAD-IB family hydrolase [Candidatus Zambryskibacteria bacterium]